MANYLHNFSICAYLRAFLYAWPKINGIMITLMVLPNFKGTKVETFKALILSVSIDCAYLLPILF